jgi:hypothetical protein
MAATKATGPLSGCLQRPGSRQPHRDGGRHDRTLRAHVYIAVRLKVSGARHFPQIQANERGV